MDTGPVAAAAKSLQSCPTLCDPIDSSPPGSSVPGILQARILEWVAISFSNACMYAKLLQSCPTLCDPMNSSPPGSSIHRILQARILEWVSISFSSRDTGPGIGQIPFSSCWIKDRAGDSWLDEAEDQGAKGWEKHKGNSYHCCLPTSMKTFQLS